MDTKQTSIMIDENLMQQCLKITGIKSKSKLIDYALRQIVQLDKQQAILKLKGKVVWDGNQARN